MRVRFIGWKRRHVRPATIDPDGWSRWVLESYVQVKMHLKLVS